MPVWIAPLAILALFVAVVVGLSAFREKRREAQRYADSKNGKSR